MFFGECCFFVVCVKRVVWCEKGGAVGVLLG